MKFNNPSYCDHYALLEEMEERKNKIERMIKREKEIEEMEAKNEIVEEMRPVFLKRTRRIDEIPYEERKQIFEEKKNEVPGSKIAEKYNVSQGMVYRIFEGFNGNPKYESYVGVKEGDKKSANKKAARKPFTSDEDKLILELKSEGKKFAEIARELNRKNESSVRNRYRILSKQDVNKESDVIKTKEVDIIQERIVDVVEKEDKLTSSSVAKWLLNECTDQEFAETFAVICRNVEALRGSDFNVRSFDVDNMQTDYVTNRIKDELDRIKKIC